MIYSVNLLDLAEKINPLAFSRYLKDTGWLQFQSKRTNVRIYQLEQGNNFFQVVIPTDKELSDYKQAMYKAIETLATVEQKTVEQVMLYLLNPNTDILKIRLSNDNVEAGNILFDDAIRLYENAKKLLGAAALDILHPRKYHQGRVDDTVSKFLSNCKFGQTEIGSYVVSIVCPFAELDENMEYKQLSIFSEEEECANSLTRQVTNRVMNNIAEIKGMIDNDNLDCLMTNSSHLISANFYEALNGLNLGSEGTALEFTAEWSPVVKNTTGTKSRVSLTHDYYQPIETVISKLKERKNTSTTIIGRIRKLESSPDLEKRTNGKITVVYLDENDKKRTVTADLNKNDYEKAITAHATGSHVEITGELKTGRNAAVSCDSFSIIN